MCRRCRSLQEARSACGGNRQHWRRCTGPGLREAHDFCVSPLPPIITPFTLEWYNIGAKKAKGKEPEHTMPSPVIECVELTKAYSKRIVALNNLTLTINEGASFGLLGENGA